LFQIFALAEV